NLVAKRVRKRIQHGAGSSRHWWFANTSGAHRRLGGGYAQGFPRHLLGHVEDGRRAVLVEAFRQRNAVLLVVYRLLSQSVAHAENGAPDHLSPERARVNYRSYLG